MEVVIVLAFTALLFMYAEMTRKDAQVSGCASLFIWVTVICAFFIALSIASMIGG